MSVILQLVYALMLGIALNGTALARSDTEIEPVQTLIAFGSNEGVARLARATARVDFAPLANQFEAQSNIAFCGPTTAAIVLNALRTPGNNVPHDRSRLHAEDSRYLPPGLDLSIGRYTQESVVAKGRKTRAQVFGEPSLLNGRMVRDGGYQLRQLDELLRAHDLVTRLVIAEGTITDADIRRDLIGNLNQAGDFVIVNYQRTAVGQSGGGHISPLGAYDAESDSVLILDVNPSLHTWVWMPVSTLIHGMRTRDAVENRGYILVRQR